VPQNLASGITIRDGRADPRASWHVSRKCEQLPKRAFGVRFRRGYCDVGRTWENVKQT